MAEGLSQLNEVTETPRQHIRGVKRRSSIFEPNKTVLDTDEQVPPQDYIDKLSEESKMWDSAVTELHQERKELKKQAQSPNPIKVEINSERLAEYEKYISSVHRFYQKMGQVDELQEVLNKKKELLQQEINELMRCGADKLRNTRI